MFKRIIIIIWMILIVGFSYSQEPTTESDQTRGIKLPATPQDGYAMVYIVRPSELDPFSKFYIFLDKKSGENRIGHTRGMEYLYFQVTPGKHRIISEGRNSKYKDIDVQKGQIVFIKQHVKLDIDNTNLDNMEILDPAEGRYIVSHTSIGTLDQH